MFSIESPIIRYVFTTHSRNHNIRSIHFFPARHIYTWRSIRNVITLFAITRGTYVRHGAIAIYYTFETRVYTNVILVQLVVDVSSHRQWPRAIHRQETVRQNYRSRRTGSIAFIRDR